MNRGLLVGTVFAVLILTVLVLLYLNFGSPVARPGPRPAAPPPSPTRTAAMPTAATLAPAPARATPGGPGRRVVLYFQGADVGLLFAEEREAEAGTDDNARARRVLEELIAGPRKDLLPTLPPGTRVREVYFDAAGTTYVDFSREIVTRHIGGSSEELMTVDSVVNSLARNLPQVRAVVFLVEGKPVVTLAGHVDLGEPLYPSSLRIAE